MTAESARVKVMGEMIEFVSPSVEVADRVYSAFDRSCRLSTYFADPSQRSDFEHKVREEFSTEKLSELIGFPPESLGNAEHQFALFRHCRLFVLPYSDDLGTPIIAIERTNNLEHWRDIVDVLSKSETISIDDLRRRSYDILQRRMTTQEFLAFVESDR